MSKNLKLVGLATYTGVATTKEGKLEADVIRRGEIACFTDEVAEKVLEGGRINAEGDWVCYWQEAPDDASINHNFTPEQLKVKKLTEEERATMAAAAVKKPPQRVARRTRV